MKYSRALLLANFGMLIAAVQSANADEIAHLEGSHEPSTCLTIHGMKTLRDLTFGKKPKEDIVVSAAVSGVTAEGDGFGGNSDSIDKPYTSLPPPAAPRSSIRGLTLSSKNTGFSSTSLIALGTPGGAIATSTPSGAARMSTLGGAANTSTPGGAVSTSSPGGATATSSPFANPVTQPVGAASGFSSDDGAMAGSPRDALLLDPDAVIKPGTKRPQRIAQSTTSTSPQSDNSNGPKRLSYPPPLDPVFPMTEYVGSAGTLPIGVPDTDPQYPLEKAIYKVLPQLREHRIKIYGWVNPGYGYSSSKYSNIPNSYAIVPNRPELDQLILRTERIPDTTQREKCDWGFRLTSLYGIDYRWTTAEGWYPATKQLLQHNMLYGYDMPEMYGMFYVPKVAKGMVLKFGRFISPPDIEAQLAPDNFMWTHSQMFTYDCYTQTGVLATIKLNDNWSVQGGIHAGCDTAPWDKGAIPTGEFFVRWVSKSNNDSIYAGVDAINNGRYRGARTVLGQQQMINSVNGLIRQSADLNGGSPDRSVGNFTNFDGSTYQYNYLKPIGKDNLQQFNATWSHRWNKKGTIVSLSEVYFLYQLNALTGGTVNNGPARTYNALTGPGTYINGFAPTLGVVNYTAFKLTNKDYICVRPIDYLLDYKGQRSGFPTTMTSWTINWTHRFNDLLMIRPEIRYDRALSYHNGTIVKPYDNGARRYQFTFGLDLIARF